jgi:DNA-binding transcriptional MerR regulator
MRTYSTTEAARKLGIHRVNLQKAIAGGRITPPRVTNVGGVRVRLWTAKDIERARKNLKKES